MRHIAVILTNQNAGPGKRRIEALFDVSLGGYR